MLGFQREQLGLENTPALGFYLPVQDVEARGVEVSQLPQPDDVGCCQSISQCPVAGVLVFPRSFPQRCPAPCWARSKQTRKPRLNLCSFTKSYQAKPRS